MLMTLPFAARAQTPSSSSQAVWTNDHARLVVESVDRDGRLTGTYQNSGNFSCGGVAYRVTGVIDGARSLTPLCARTRAAAATCSPRRISFATVS